MLILLSPLGAYADKLTWDGSASGYWGTGANWDTGTTPQDGDDLVFPAGPARLATTNNTSSTHRFRSITISGANCALRGNGLTLSNGISATYGAGSSASVELDITLAQSQTFECATDNAILYITGDIALGSYALVADATGNMLLGGAISGTGGLLKYGTGYLRLYGSTANTYTGSTVVNVGTLQLNKTSGVNAVGGDLVVGNNTGDSETVQWLNNAQLPSTTDVTVNSGALLDLNNHTEALGALTLNAGDVETGSGTLTLGGNVTAGGVDGIASIRGNLSLGAATRTFDILPDPDGSYPQIYIYATVSGSGGILKTGAGALSLAGTNTYSGLTVVSGGALVVDASAALGDAASGTTVGTGGELHLRGNAQVGNESLTVTGSGPATPSHYSLGCFGGMSNSWAGPVTLAGDVGISLNSDTSLEFTGPIGGTGGFTTVGLGTLILSGSEANTFTGDVQVHTGSLHLNKSFTDGALPGPGTLTIGDGAGGSGDDVVRSLRNAQIDGSVAITVNSSGVLHLNGFNETIGPLTLNAGQVQTLTGTLTLGSDVTARATNLINSWIAGRLALGSSTRAFDVAAGGRVPELQVFATVSGTGGLRKTGRGLMSLSRSNIFSGLLTVAEGGLLAEDNNALGAATQGSVVEAGARLSVGPDVHVGDEPLTLYGDGATSYCLSTSGIGSNSWAGPITLEGNSSAWVYDGCHLNLAGPISGPGGFTKTGFGTLIYSGSSGNTYAGDTVVEYGTLELGKAGGTAAAIRYGTLFIGDGVGGADADVVRLVADNQLWSTVPIIITASGWLDLDGHKDIVGPLTFSAGRASSGAGGLIRLGGDVTANFVSSGRPTIEGNVLLDATRVFTIANSGGSPDLSLSAAISGDGGLTKTGAGALSLAASNAFTGAVTINEGLIYLYDNAALGSTAGGTLVNKGGVLVLADGRAVGAEPLTLNGNGDGKSGALASVGGSNSWAGPVTFATDSVITVQTNQFLNLAGALGGPAGFIKAQPGTLLLSGATANKFAGNAVVDAGRLDLDKAVSDGALPGPGDLFIGTEVGNPSDVVVREWRDDQIAGGVDITVNRSGSLELHGHSDAVGGLALLDGSVWLGTGTLTLGGNVAATGSRPFIFYGNLNLGDVTRTFHVTNTGVIWAMMDIEAHVSGAGGILKTGEGLLSLFYSNSYGGLTTVADGSLEARDDSALGSAAAGTVVQDGASLRIVKAHIGMEPLSLSGMGGHDWATLYCYDYGDDTLSNSWAGTITLESDVRIGVDPTNTTLNLLGAMNGPGGFTKNRFGTLILSGTGANTYAGTTYVNEGTLVLAKTVAERAIPGPLVIGNDDGGPAADVVRLEGNNQIVNAASVTVSSSGLLDLNGHYDRVDAVSGSGSIALGSGYLIAGHNGSSFAFDGLVSGTGYLWKVGAGTWTLTGDNTYSGTTKVEDGTLLVNGSQPASDVLVQSLGTLGGTGTVGRLTSIGGALSPGLSPGTLTSSNLLPDSATHFVVELTGGGSDRLNVRGKVALGDARLVLSAPGLLPAEGQQFVILDNDETDAVTGAFGGVAEGAVVSAGPRQFRITYAGGTGNDVVLIATNTAALRPTLFLWPTDTNSVVVSWPVSDIAWLLHCTTNLAQVPILWTEIPPPTPRT